MVMLTRAACRCACVLTRIVLVEKRVDGCPECRCLHFDFDRLIVGAHVGHHVRGPSVGGVRRPLGRPLGWVASLIRTLATMNLEISWADMPGALLMMVAAARVGFACKHLLQKVKGAASRLARGHQQRVPRLRILGQRSRARRWRRARWLPNVCAIDTCTGGRCVNSSANRGRAAFGPPSGDSPRSAVP